MASTTTANKAYAKHPSRCGSRTKNGRYCKLPAGHNTDHPGIGTCYKHGGRKKTALKEAGIELAHKGIMNPKTSAADMVEIEPHNGLLIAVRSAAGEFFYWQQRVRENPESLTIIKEMREARMQMARLSKMSLDAGLAERQVALQERMADLMAQFAIMLFEGLHLTAQQEALVPGLVERTMLALEAGEDYEHTPRPKQALINYKVGEVIEGTAA